MVDLLKKEIIHRNEKDISYFEELSKDRAESADMLEKPSMRGIKNSVVDKYSDQAHFIYELLQNADDVGAEYVKFILESNRLIFIHNGTRHFSVSNPKNEEADSKQGRLGDINAITSIANSNKTEASIGKFGVGFKAVFQYTSTPHIYDQNYQFKIERFIVPKLVAEDYPGRKEEETVFIFPFDHPDKSAEDSFCDVAEKLQSLTYPLLFLTNLKSIQYQIGYLTGYYKKEIIELREENGISIKKIRLDREAEKDELLLFSRKNENNQQYSVGFFIDDDEHLRPVQEPAFCFFPTKEDTGLNFIIHAPFLLTDSREGIRAGIDHNEKMIKDLAALSAESMLLLRDLGEEKTIRLIDDTIIKIIPVDEEIFGVEDSRRKISFKPFFKKIKRQFQTEALLPTKTGYTTKENAYWADTSQLTQLFSDQQISQICENENAHWVFRTISRSEIQRYQKPLFEYIESLVRTHLNEDVIIGGRNKEFYYNRLLERNVPLENIKGITSDYIETQSVTWLHMFYKWISETKHRTESILKKPVFLNQNGKATAAYDEEGHPILFQSQEIIPGYQLVSQELLINQDTKDFLEQIGVQEPALKDRIYNIILPQYAEGGKIDSRSHFKLFFDYYCTCTRKENEELIDMIRGYKFLMFFQNGSSHPYRGEPDSIYMPTPELKELLCAKKDAQFLALDEYVRIVGECNRNQLLQFMSDLGVSNELHILVEEIDYHQSKRSDLPVPHSTREIKYEERIIDGCKELVGYIAEHKDKSKSVLLWNTLIRIIKKECNNWEFGSISSLIVGNCHYFYRTPKIQQFESSDASVLRKYKWIVNRNGEYVAPRDIVKTALAEDYDLTTEAADDLIAFLHIKEVPVVGDTDNLTELQREKIEFADKVREMGIDESDLEDLKEFKRQKEERQRIEKRNRHRESVEGRIIEKEESVEEPSWYEENLFEGKPGNSDNNKVLLSKKKSDEAANHVIREIIEMAYEDVPMKWGSINDAVENDTDADELIPQPIDYEKRIEKAKQKSALEIDRIAHFEELQKKAITEEKYSYGWFKTLLEMESLNRNESALRSKEVSIVFTKVEKEPGAKRTLVLKHPNRYIPQFMEDLADIPMILQMGEESKSVVIEAANIKSYTLRVKLKNSTDIGDIDLSAITSVSIDAKSPAFLLEELRKKFNELGYDDSFNMRENLCENIEFVFGPPGTGKTTHLARNVLLPMMNNSAKCRVLVLTPTNKAADVLVRRIMEITGDEKDYVEWLIRFGGTADEYIEQSGVCKEKTFDIRSLKKSVTITTIARFPYDYFMPQMERLYLNNIKWDYIVIDEASMIPLVNIVYPLFQKTPKKFVIAGDPFQIEPISSVGLWKNENIYTFVKLNSFMNPKTVPHDYEVKLLTTQYRSIPSIGNIFSKFAYGGILKHFRSEASQKKLLFKNMPTLNTLNIIKFPVSKYESIYRAKRLQHSSAYQIYSALFTFEYVKYLTENVIFDNSDDILTIGVIAPYRAQAELIDRLINSESFPGRTNVQVGTIHGFQGDECDVIIDVFNTPPNITASNEMFLNKMNIINVSISRAREYLFLIIPDDNTENLYNLKLVKRVENLMKASERCSEFITSDLEKVMFNETDYLENNTFSTSHQNINVYGIPEKKYEIRAEDTAVDVQIHRKYYGKEESGFEGSDVSNLIDKQNDGKMIGNDFLNSIKRWF